MSMASKQTRTEDDERFIRDSFSSLWIALVFVLISIAIYWFGLDPPLPAYLNNLNQTYSIVFGSGCGLLAFVALLSAYFMKKEHAFGQTKFKSSDKIAYRILPFAALLTLAGLALIIFATGGSRSPFSHFLIAASSLAIVFARKSRTRLGLIFGSILLYGVSLPEILNLIPGIVFNTPESNYIFGLFCLLVAIVAVSVAAWKTDDEEDSSSPPAGIPQGGET